MSLSDGHDALIAHLKTLPGLPGLVLPNDPGSASLPRLVVQAAGGSQQTRTVKGITQADAEIVARIETEDGKFDTEAKTLAKAVVAHFPVTLRIGPVTILQAPLIQAGFGVSAIYNLPVVIRGRHYF